MAGNTSTHSSSNGASAAPSRGCEPPHRFKPSSQLNVDAPPFLPRDWTSKSGALAGQKVQRGGAPTQGLGSGLEEPIWNFAEADVGPTASTGSAPFGCMLAAARPLENLDSVHYPPGIRRPDTTLNVHATARRFRYDREFLLQFQHICTAKPEFLIPLAAYNLEPRSTTPHSTARGPSVKKAARGRAASRAAQTGPADSDDPRNIGGAGLRSDSSDSCSGSESVASILSPECANQHQRDKSEHVHDTPGFAERKLHSASPRPTISQPTVQSSIAGASAAALPKNTVKARIQVEVDRLFATRELDTTECAFRELPSRFHSRLVDGLASRAISGGEEEAAIVTDLFRRMAVRRICTPAMWEEGLTPAAGAMGTGVARHPDALRFFEMLVSAAGLQEDAERGRRLKQRCMGA